MNEPELILIRGLPGSGKSTLAKGAYPKHLHIETDMYFVDGEGNYEFEGSKIKAAHEWCQKTVKEHLDRGHNIVVSNTFTQRWELEPYLKMCKHVEVIEATGEFENVHGVPEAIIRKMKERWEAL